MSIWFLINNDIITNSNYSFRNWIKFQIFTARQRSVREGNAFTGVCLSTGGWGEYSPPLPIHGPRILQDKVDKRAVRILLECFLVLVCYWRCRCGKWMHVVFVRIAQETIVVTQTGETWCACPYVWRQWGNLNARTQTQRRIRIPNLMATLYYTEHVHITQTRIRISTPYFCIGQESISESVCLSHYNWH